MPVTCTPDIDVDSPVTETQTQRKRGGWRLHPQPRIGLDLGSDDELLMIENMTGVRWIIYHKYHRLSIIEPNELLVFHVPKHGTLSALPYEDSDDPVEYLTLPLIYDVTYVQIYLHSLSKGVDVYDMRVA